MSINNVNSMNKADLVKLALAKKAGQTQQTQKPAYLTMQGSIFNAPRASKLKNPTLADQNIKKSISDLTGENSPKKTSSTQKTSNETVTGGSMSLSEGKAAIKQAGSLQNEIKGLTTQAQNDNKVVAQFNKNAQKLENQMLNEEKAFKLAMKKEENAFLQTQKQIQETIKDIEQNDSELKAMVSELQSVSSSSVSGGNNAAQINELQSKINQKTSLGQAYGAKINTLQKTSSRSVNYMNKASTNFLRTQAKNSMAIEHNQSATDKVITFAEKADVVAQLVTQGGQLLDYAGKGLVALGATIPTGGQALIAVGGIMQKIGKVSVMVGSYGSSAANLTKTVAYTAKGNLQEAMKSAGAAIMSGAAAAKSTSNLQSDMQGINNQVQDASTKLEALKTAKAEVTDGKGVIEGMNKRQSTKAIQAEILNGKTVEEARTAVTETMAANTKTATDNIKSGLKDGVEFGDKHSKKATRQAARNTAAGAKSSIAKYEGNHEPIDKPANDKLFEKLQKYGSGMMSMASMLPASNTTSSGYRSIQLSPQAQEIINKHRNRSASINRMYAA